MTKPTPKPTQREAYLVSFVDAKTLAQRPGTLWNRIVNVKTISGVHKRMSSQSHPDGSNGYNITNIKI